MAPGVVQDPSSLGLDASRLGNIDRWMDAYVRAGKYAGW